MVTDRAEKAQDENRSDCEGRSASSDNEIPKWTGVASISCSKLNEILCCQRLAHSVLFYIFVGLFLLVFVYILRKLVSLPAGHSKNGSRKPSNSAPTTVHNNSRDAFTKKRPQIWPTVDNIVEHLPVDPTIPTAIISSKDKTRIYNETKGGEKSYVWSGFARNNQNPIPQGVTHPSRSQNQQGNYFGRGTVGSGAISQVLNKKNVYNPAYSNPNGENPSTALVRENSEWAATSNSKNNGFERTYAENSGLGNARDEWSTRDFPGSSGVEKTGSDWSTKANVGFTGLGKMNSRFPAWNSNGYSGSDFGDEGYTRIPQTGDSDLSNSVTVPAASDGSYGNWETKSSTWPKPGSSWRAGSGLGWYRGDSDSKNPYIIPSSQKNRFYYNRASGKWTYPTNTEDSYDYYNHKPANKMVADANADRFGYSKATVNSNNWNTNYNYGETNQTDDWSNSNTVNGQNGGMLKTITNSVGENGYPATTNPHRQINLQHRNSPKVVGEEMDDSIHRWPLEEGRGEEPVDDESRYLHTSLSGHSSKQTNVDHVQRKKLKHRRHFAKSKKEPKKEKRKGKAKDNNHQSTKNEDHVIIHKKTKARKNVKKSTILHRPSFKSHSKRRQVKHRKVKSKVISKVRTKLRGEKPRLFSNVRRLKIRLHDKRHPTNRATRKNTPKRLTKRFPSYSSYKRFVKRHQISDVLVGNWHHAMHRIRHCETLTQFKTNGMVKLSRQYSNRKRRYRYTILTCRNTKENSDDDDSEDSDYDSDLISRAGSQICREFWYITDGRIILRKLKGGHSRKTYIVTLCKKGSSPTGLKDISVRITKNEDDSTDNDNNNNADSAKKDNDHVPKPDVTISHDDNDIQNDDTDTTKESDDDADVDDKTATDQTTKNDRNNNDDEDLDDDLDDDLDLDDDNRDSDGAKITKGPGKEKYYSNRNSKDGDFDKDGDNDDPKTDDKTDDDKTDDDNTATETDDILTDTTSSGGSLATHDHDSDGEDTNTNTEKKHKRKNAVPKSKAKKGKVHGRNSMHGNIKKSLTPKSRHRHLKSHKVLKATNKKTHKTASNRDAKKENSYVYERLREILTKNNDISNDDGVFVKLLEAISQKNSKSETNAKRKEHKKARKHLRKFKTDIRKGRKKESKLFKSSRTNDTNAIRDLLQKFITNTNNVKSPLQVTEKTPTAVQKGETKDTKEEQTKATSAKPAPQMDANDLLKALLPSFLQRSTTAATTPTVQPTVATTHAPDPAPIQSLLSKLGIKDNLNGNTNSAVFQGLLPGKKSRDGLSTDKILDTKRTSAFAHEIPPLKDRQLGLSPKASEPISFNATSRPSAQIQTPDNSLRSYIPTEKSKQSKLKSTQLSHLTPVPPSFTTDARNAVATSNPRGIKHGTTSATMSGYLAYRSPNDNRYPFQTPLMNVLCFGDSLTSGYYNHGRGNHPYSIRLNQLLNPGGMHHYKIITRGMVGEMVHGSMTKRLPKVLNEFDGTRFDWILILGGTNDVAHVKNFGDDEQFTKQLINVWSPKIVNDIEKLHETARKYGARTVLMTIPETAYELWPEFQSIRNMRLSVNAALRQYATQVRDTTVLCDLAIKLPRSSLSKELQKLYWNDHIHMNPIGYNKMAEIIDQCIRPYLTKK